MVSACNLFESRDSLFSRFFAFYGTTDNSKNNCNVCAPELSIRIRIDLALQSPDLDPYCIGKADPDPGARSLTKIYK
jgi:hypothetical protein